MKTKNTTIENPIEANEVDALLSQAILSIHQPLNLITSGLESEGDSKINFINLAIQRISVPFENRVELIKELKDRRKLYLANAQALASTIEQEWVESISAFGRTRDGSGNPLPIVGGGDGWSYRIDAPKAVADASREVLDALCKRTNLALLGAPSLKSAKGKKAPKPSYTENPNFGSLTDRESGFSPVEEGEKEADWSIKAALRFMISDESKAGKRFVKAVELIARCVKHINEHNPSEALKCYHSLLGSDGTGRFAFPKPLLDSLIRVRFIGLTVAMLQGEIKYLDSLTNNADALREWKDTRKAQLEPLNKVMDAILPAEGESAVAAE